MQDEELRDAGHPVFESAETTAERLAYEAVEETM
jgi:hypothetical protein